MKIFKCYYQNIKKQGVMYIPAKNLEEATQKIQKKSVIIIHIKEITWFAMPSSKTRELENIFWQLGFGFNSGLHIITVLESIKEGLYHKDNIMFLESMLSSLYQGDTLSKALKEHSAICGSFVVALFEIGEKSGYLSQTCELCAKELGQKNEFLDSIRKALLYPSILGFALVCVFIILSFFVIPEFGQIYNDLDTNLPLSTESIIIVSRFLHDFFFEIIIGFIFILFVYILLLKNKMYRDKMIIITPILNTIVIDYELYRYFLGLHYFIKSQITFEKSIETCNELIDNMYLKGKFSCITDLLHRGIPLSRALEEIDIHIANLVLLQSGEKSGTLDQALQLNAEFYKRRYKHTLQTLHTLIEPFATMIMGLFVAWLVFSIVSPMWGLLEVAV